MAVGTYVHAALDVRGVVARGEEHSHRHIQKGNDAARALKDANRFLDSGDALCDALRLREAIGADKIRHLRRAALEDWDEAFGVGAHGVDETENSVLLFGHRLLALAAAATTGATRSASGSRRVQ